MEGARRRPPLERQNANRTGTMTLSTKQDIRAEILCRRRALEPQKVRANSHSIGVLLDASTLLRKSSDVLAYVSAKDNEVDTHGIIRQLLAEGKTVCVPVSGMKQRVMQWSLLLAMEELERTHFGLLEPAALFRRINPIPTGAVCLVPGVAFTRNGWRIGYGGGYFDRFLDAFDGVSVGLAHDIQIVDHIPTEPYDRPVDYLITESGMTNCRELRNREATGA